MSGLGPSRSQTDLAEMVEMLLDKGIVINADIVVSVGETELLGVQLRAAIASFETAAQYGLEFPEGTDTRRLKEATARSGEGRLDEVEADRGDDEDDGAKVAVSAPVTRRPPGGGVPGRPSPKDPQVGTEGEEAERPSDAGATEGDDAGDATDGGEMAETVEAETADSDEDDTTGGDDATGERDADSREGGE